jgi:hypothetical protein
MASEQAIDCGRGELKAISMRSRFYDMRSSSAPFAFCREGKPAVTRNNSTAGREAERHDDQYQQDQQRQFVSGDVGLPA